MIQQKRKAERIANEMAEISGIKINKICYSYKEVLNYLEEVDKEKELLKELLKKYPELKNEE